MGSVRSVGRGKWAPPDQWIEGNGLNEINGRRNGLHEIKGKG